MRLFRKKDRGAEVLDIQTKLVSLGYKIGSSGPDGVFGPETEKAIRQFQKDRGLNVDGIVGPKTWQQIVEASYQLGDRTLYLHSPFLKGDDINRLQKNLNSMGFNIGLVDSVFGPRTEEAVREFQKSTGIQADGIVGPSTIKALENLQRLYENNLISEHPGVNSNRPATALKIFKGRRVGIDYCFDPDVSPKSIDLSQARKLAEEIALRVGNLVSLIGGEIKYSFRPGRYPGLNRRLRSINRFHPDAVVSIGLYQDENNETSCQIQYFQEGNYVSKDGFRLAEKIEEYLNELKNKEKGLLGGELIPILKRTLAPAVLVKVINLSDSQELKMAGDDIFRQKIAVAIFDGLKAFFTEG